MPSRSPSTSFLIALPPVQAVIIVAVLFSTVTLCVQSLPYYYSPQASGRTFGTLAMT